MPWIPLLLVVTFTLSACGGDPRTALDAGAVDTRTVDTNATVDVDVDVDADTATQPSTVYARRITTRADLVTGQVDFAEVGKAFVVGNDRARFLVQDVGSAPLYSIYGGSLMGADLVRSETPGESALREILPVIDFRVLAPDRVFVADDGAAGDRAVIRVEGELRISQAIDLADAFAGDAPVEVALEYEVRPDEAAVRIRTIVENPTDTAVSVMSGDFMIAGNLLRLFAPRLGFEVDGAVGEIAWLGMGGEHVSYAYVHPTVGPVNPPAAENSGTFAVHTFDLAVPAGGTRVVERLLLVGDGTIESVAAPAVALLALPSGRVTGRVTRPDGAAQADVWVTALGVPADGGPGVRATNQGRTDADGRYVLTLPPGDHDLVAHRGERRPSEPVRVSVTDGGTVSADLTLADPVTVRVALTGDGPRPSGGGTFPTRLTLRPRGDDHHDPRLGLGDRWRGWRLEFLGAGRDTFEVMPGRYDVVMSRGPRYERISLTDVELAEGTVLTGHLTESVVVPGWVACDFHQHTIGSLDSSTTFEMRVRENLGQGLGCFATTEHDHVVDLGPTIEALGAEPALHSVIGDEVSMNGIAHINAYPLPIDAAAPYALSGVKLWAGLTVDAVIAKLRALAGERVIQLNHPRRGFSAYFSYLRMNPWDQSTEALPLAGGFDGLEVNDSLGQPWDFTPDGWADMMTRRPGDVPVMADWFGLLNQGLTVAGIANSDCHDPGDDCGNPHSYLNVGVGPGALTDADVVRAVKAQKAIGSRGIFLRVTANGEARMGHAELVDARSPVTLVVEAEAPSYVAVSHVELYRDGQFVEERDAPGDADQNGTVQLETRFTLAPLEDTWVVVVARGGGSTSPVFSGAPFAFTNPIYLDADGDGAFTPPGPVPLPDP